MSTPASLLFQPTQVGRLNLAHRVVLAPLNRFRNFKHTHVPLTGLMKEYYAQRASTPGTLLIGEATIISLEAAGYENGPGIWSEEQINAWKEIVDEVHSKGSYIYLQIYALGRAALPSGLEADNITIVGPSSIPVSSRSRYIPRELTKEDINRYIERFSTAAKNAVFKAGFDGVEIHGANGYLIHEFLEDVSNHRTDEYGGSIENRSRFALEVVKAVADAIGEDRTALRVSPWFKGEDMGMHDPRPQYSHLIRELKAAHPNLAYLHTIEPRLTFERGEALALSKPSNDFIRDIWTPKPLISAGGYTRQTAIRTSQETGDLIAFGRDFIANPDLPKRLLQDLPLNKYDRETFYVAAENPNPESGYIDYPFYSSAKELDQGLSVAGKTIQCC